MDERIRGREKERQKTKKNKGREEGRKGAREAGVVPSAFVLPYDSQLG